MDAAAAVRYARQIALPEVGPDGQARICAARVLVVGRGPLAETAALYLRAGGAREVIERPLAPPDGAAWLAALDGIDLVVRAGFDDDALLGAAARTGVPVIVTRATADAVDLVGFPAAPRSPYPSAADVDSGASWEVPPRAAEPNDAGAAAVVAGTLAAAEALTMLARAPEVRRGAIRHLRLPLDGGAPLAQQIGAG